MVLRARRSLWLVFVAMAVTFSAAVLLVPNQVRANSPTRSNPKSTSQVGMLLGVSCTSASDCIAVGSGDLVEHWNGKSWKAMQNAPDANGSSLFGISCKSPRACTAVGSNDGPFAEHWNGTAWKVQDTPSPANGAQENIAQLDGVSCSPGRACEAVGSVLYSYIFAEKWNGSRWVLQTAPPAVSPWGSPEGLFGVSCATWKACTAVGGYPMTLAERWNGTAWTVQSTPEVGDTFNFLHGVSCTSRSVCTAVGAVQDPGLDATLALRWNGVSWAVMTTPKSATGVETSQDELDGVSCSSASACTAVGTYADPFGFQTLALRWNGTAWRVQRTPKIPGSDARFLEAVSCVSTTACTAAGYYGNDSLTEIPLAEQWNGHSWRITLS
jgi:hypothetical protein